MQNGGGGGGERKEKIAQKDKCSYVYHGCKTEKHTEVMLPDKYHSQQYPPVVHLTQTKIIISNR